MRLHVLRFGPWIRRAVTDRQDGITGRIGEQRTERAGRRLAVAVVNDISGLERIRTRQAK
jgi:hypothetical protein